MYQEFNSLDAHREACAAYVLSQRLEGWVAVTDRYDDGGISGGTLERPALERLFADIEFGKVDRLSRSLMDFSKLVEVFDRIGVTFVSVTQSFTATTSMGRLTLNILLSFAQFEREVNAERIRDKVRASRIKGVWMGGVPPLGYDVKDRKLIINPKEARHVCWIFERFVETGSGNEDGAGAERARHHHEVGPAHHQGLPLPPPQQPAYIGEVVHKGKSYPGEHEAIIDQRT